MFENASETYLDLVGDRTRVRTSRVTQTLFVKDRLGSQLLLITQQGKPLAVFPATDRNIEVILCAGLRIHEYVMYDGEVDYREIAESRDHFEADTEEVAFGSVEIRAPRLRLSSAGR
ncbi:MAG TPA: hypothetical protein VIH96_06135 [Paraburkholderia sp.]